MKSVIYFTRPGEEYANRNMEHMIGEKLLETGLRREYGLDLAFEPRAAGEHGKPFFTLQPQIHYNITHSGEYVACIFAGEEVGIDIQKHKKANYERMLERMVPAHMIREILEADEPEKAFFAQWVLREAYIKWTGEGLSRDLRTIPMDSGHYILLDLDPGYSGAVWSKDVLDIRWEYEEIHLEQNLDCRLNGQEQK
ncbi:MAG: 4'-phosphopantetheinyl transferase superfamily protein [Eubacteriales bacterium]|nr:4'-phosphopantetheinyl transferase superfamily protein [Eubacteriales bacterium]